MTKFIIATLTAVHVSAHAVDDYSPHVDIIREVPGRDINHISQQFHDFDSMAMWLEDRLQDGGDPYVTRVVIYPKGKDYAPPVDLSHNACINVKSDKDFPILEKLNDQKNSR